MQRAADVVAPGGTVVVQDGVYSAEGCSDTIVCVTRGGTASAPVTFKSERRWGAILDGGNSTPQGIEVKADYVRIEGFEIRNFANPGGSGGGVTLYSGGRGSVIADNHIHHIGRVCTETSNGQKAIYLKQSNVTVERNYIHDIGRLGPGENGCSYPSSYEGWQNHDHGIYTSASDTSLQGTVIRGNYFARHERGWAIHVYPGAWTNVTIENNTFVHGNPYRNQSHIVLSDLELSDTRISGNTFYDPNGGGAIRLSGELSLSNISISGNMTTGPQITVPSNPPSGVTLAANILDAQIPEPPPPRP